MNTEAGLGEPMASDHRRILATAISRLRAKIKYRPVVFELAPDLFTLLNLQRLVEAIAGLSLHKQNFRRLLDRTGLVEGAGEFDTSAGGRPAELFRCRREALSERPVGGVHVPAPRERSAHRRFANDAITQRIDAQAVDMHLIVQVHAGGVASAAHAGDRRARGHEHAGLQARIDFFEVRIKCAYALAVIELQQISVSAAPA